MSTRRKIILVAAALIVSSLVSVGLYLLELRYIAPAKPPPVEPAQVIREQQPEAATSHINKSLAKNGLTVAEVYAEPVSLIEAQGTPVPVDNTIVQKGTTLKPRLMNFDLKFDLSYLAPVILMKGKTELELTPVATNKSKGVVRGNKAFYSNAYTGTDLERSVLSRGIKETYILKETGHPTWFDTTLKTNLTAHIEKDGSIRYYDGEVLIAFSPAPFIVDDKGVHRRARYTINKDTIRVWLPEDMSGLTYPIKLDPTTYFESDSSDGYIGFDDLGTGYVYSGDQYLEVARDGANWTADSWLRFPLTGIEGTIVSATLNLYYGESVYNNGSFTIPIDHVPDFGVLDETDWATAPYASNIDPSPVTPATPIGWHELDITSSVQDDIDNFRALSAYRLRMNGAGSWYARFSSAEASGYKPYLRIVYQANETVVHSEITNPVDQSYIRGATYQITGTATPGQDLVPVSLVEVSTDGGATWNAATGTTDWTYDWTLPADGGYVIKSRATSGSVETPASGVRVTVDNTPPVTAITAPLPNAVVSVAMPIVGSASDALFSQYIIEYGKGASPDSWFQLGGSRLTPVDGGTLADVNTYRLENDTYTFRVTTSDLAGNVTTASVAVSVNNGTRPESPHGNYQLDTDLCALCHGTHTAVLAPGILKLGATKFQSQLCYTCHDGTGSVFDIAAEFDSNPVHHPIQDLFYEGDPNHTMNCSDCHDPHGSEEIAGQSYPALLRVKDDAGNKFYSGDPYCYACHGAGGSIKNMTYFETNNGHANTDPDQTAVMPDPASGTKIKCSRCHAPHGSQYTRLHLNVDKILCDECHAETPYTIRADNEVVTGVGYPDIAFGQPYYAGIRLFSQDTFNAPPVSLKGPKEFRAGNLNYAPRLRDVAIGDADNDGINDVVATVADGANDTLIIWPGSLDGFSLLPPRIYANRGGYGVAIGDVNDDNQNEILATTLDAPYELKVCQFIGSTLNSATAYPTNGSSPRKIAIADITGDGLNDAVVTNYGSNDITVFRQSLGSLIPVGPSSASGSYPYGVAIGDVNNDAIPEVVVVDQGYQSSPGVIINPPYTLDVIQVFQSDGVGNLSLISSLDNGDATVAWDVAIGNVVDNTTGPEVLVAGHPLYDTGLTNNGRLTVFNLVDNTSDAIDSLGTDTKGIAVGDANGDDSIDAVALNGSSISVFPHTATAPLAAPTVIPMAGMNTVGIADEPGPIAIGNVTKSHPYGHRIEVMSVCTDCHDPHSVSKDAPIWGASGFDPVYGTPTTYTPVLHVIYDYQLCYKCHSGAAVPMVGTKDIAEELNPANQSYLSVMAQGRRSDMPAGSFVAPWTQTSRLLCGDCHGRDALAPQQPRHGSANPAFLRKPYVGMPPGENGILCYSCHDFTFYGPGAATVGPFTWDRVDSGNSHKVHSNYGINCATCHDMHGSATRPGFIKPDMNMTGNAPGPFTCTTGCH